MNLDKYFSVGYAKKLQTTAKYPNRLKDKKKVETLYSLDEFGNENKEFFSYSNTLVAIGYCRVVYGDHGPYVEFNIEHFKCELVKKFNSICPLDAYYEWLTLNDSSELKVYKQLRSVSNLPNPPSPGFRGNRSEGYADYIPGKYYISPFEFGLIK